MSRHTTHLDHDTHAIMPRHKGWLHSILPIQAPSLRWQQSLLITEDVLSVHVWVPVGLVGWCALVGMGWAWWRGC